MITGSELEDLLTNYNCVNKEAHRFVIHVKRDDRAPARDNNPLTAYLSEEGVRYHFQIDEGRIFAPLTQAQLGYISGLEYTESIEYNGPLKIEESDYSK
ncbi:MAG: hypothetical protein AABX05_05870 [Nanoarchaeota archaeon]